MKAIKRVVIEAGLTVTMKSISDMLENARNSMEWRFFVVAREIRGKGKDIKRRYAAKKPGKKARKEANGGRQRGQNRDRDPSYDLSKPFNDEQSNVSVILPNSNNLSAISDNNVTRGTFHSQNESNNNQSF